MSPADRPTTPAIDEARAVGARADALGGRVADTPSGHDARTAAVDGRPARRRAAVVRYGLVALVVVLDQITKVSIDRSLELYERIPVTSFFNVTKAYNPGAAFSFLSDAGGWQRWFFTVVSTVVSVVFVVWLQRMTPRERWLGLSIALILGGAIGNLIDRVIYGHVVDFIHVYWRDWYFPSFNVADAAITAGAAILIALTLFDKEESAGSR